MKNNKSIKKKILNTSIKSKIKTLIKKVNFSINDKNLELSKKRYIELQSFIDKKSKKNIINKNKSSRIKSKLIKKIHKIL